MYSINCQNIHFYVFIPWLEHTNPQTIESSTTELSGLACKTKDTIMATSKYIYVQHKGRKYVLKIKYDLVHAYTSLQTCRHGFVNNKETYGGI